MNSLKWKLIVIGIALMMTLIAFSVIPVHVNNGIFNTSSSSETPETEPTKNPSGENNNGLSAGLNDDPSGQGTGAVVDGENTNNQGQTVP